MMRFVVLFALCLVLSACVPGVRAQDPACYSSGSIAGIVIATIVVTLVMAGLAAAFIWYLWKQRKIGYGDTKSLEKPIVCPPMSPDKQMIARESNDYAFDNPYFKDDETDHGNPDAAEKGESGFRKDNGDIATPVQNAKTSYDKLVAKSPLKTSNGTAANNHHKKSRPFSSLPFHAVFHPSGKKQQRATMDDTYISKHLERITVPLRGHDFTGLGFNICGNMRDGIFVKDVLHRGPASESGKIKAGDRIVGVTVSFAAMVYEDALTILSYASPYDVRLEIEKAPPTGPHLPSSSPKRIGASTSFRNNGQRRLFHPLYRSQSIDDLTQIGKDGFGVMDSSGSQRDSSSSATPKRSQSVEASNVGTKSRPPFILKPDETKSTSSSKGSRTPSTSSCESTAKATTPTDKAQPVLDEEVPCTKKEAKSARFRAEQANVTSEASLRTAPPAKPARELPEDKTFNGKDSSPKSSEAAAISPADPPAYEAQKPQAASNEATNVPDGESDTEKPTAPPRKANSTPKRKAPAPPPAIKTETSAVVHRADDLQPPELPVPATETAPQEETPEPPPPPPTSELPPATDEAFRAENKSYTATHELHLTSNKLPSVFSSAEKITTDPGTGSSDTSSLASSADNSTKMEKDDQNSSPGKRKASSLGDLTKLEQGASKKTSISSAILERAVSLDLQQSIPGENLTKQKKILRAPAFEDDYLEDREDLSELNGQGLKRWDDGLDIVFAKLPNGETNSNADSSNSNEDEGKISTFDIDIDMKDESKTENKTEKIEEKPVQESSTEKSITELVDDSPVSEIPPPALQTSASIVTSTPVKRVIEVRNLNLDDSSEEEEHHDAMDDDVPYLASAADETKSNESTTKYAASSTTSNNNSTALFSPVTISIPVIKPDLTHFEKLPSPPPASTHPGLDSSWRMSKTITTTIEDGGKPSLERISVQSLYKPIFASKEIGSLDEPDPHAEKLVNGNDSDASEHYSTAHENTSTSSVETSSLSVTLSSNKDVTKTPNTIAGFAKTLIIPGPNEVENLLSLAEEPITPPPALEPPAKPTEHE